MPKIYNLTVVVEQTRKRIPIREIDSSVTADQLLAALANKIALPAGTRGVLTRKITRRELLLNQSLGDAGIEDGESLIADYMRTAGS